jgi:predicted DNA-binding ribbon-helix-helix protein
MTDTEQGPVKRSITIAGHRTSISLEPQFWSALGALAQARGLSLAALVTGIDEARGRTNLSSALRVEVLRSGLTRTARTIHNPSDLRHFMRLKPINARVQISLGDTPLADTTDALRLIEVSNDVYDPAIYIPRSDILAGLTGIVDRTTHCPIKGDAVYFTTPGWTPANEKDYFAWSYPTPVSFAKQLTGLVAFNAGHVTIIETPQG